MRFLSFIAGLILTSISKFFVCVLVASLVAFSPTESLTHIDQNVVDTCSIDHNNENPSDSDPTEPDQHFHHCGACHVHVDRRDEISKLVRSYSEPKYWVLISTSISHAAPLDLFRPPRV